MLPRLLPGKRQVDHFMDAAQLSSLTNFIWNIADDVLRDVYVTPQRGMSPRCRADRLALVTATTVGHARELSVGSTR